MTWNLNSFIFLNIWANGQDIQDFFGNLSGNNFDIVRYCSLTLILPWQPSLTDRVLIIFRSISTLSWSIGEIQKSNKADPIWPPFENQVVISTSSLLVMDVKGITFGRTSSEGGTTVSSFSRWFLINTRWHTLTTMTSPPIVLLTHYRTTSCFILALPTGYELVWQVYQWCYALFLTYGSHGRYHRFDRFLKLFFDTWCHIVRT